MKGKGKEIGGGSKTQDIGKKVKNPLKNLLDNLSLTRQNWRRQVPRFYVAYKLYQNLLVWTFLPFYHQTFFPNKRVIFFSSTIHQVLLFVHSFFT